jgi:ribosomal protein S6--L-glutamate ligase
MRKLRIGFLARSFDAESTSYIPLVMRALADLGAVVDLVAPVAGVIDLATVRPEHDLYLLKQKNGLPLSLAGALHAQGAAIVNPYPASLALFDKIVMFRILHAAGVPIPASYATSDPHRLAPLLEGGPIIVKPYQGACGRAIRVIRSAAELAHVQTGHEPVFAQRYHPPQGGDRKLYVIGARIFGVKKVFPRRTQAEKHGEPFAPTPELCEIARRCGEAFGIDLYGVDVIESDGNPYVVDMSSIPGFKGVPDAPRQLARYLWAAAARAARGEPLGLLEAVPAGCVR